MRGGSFIRQSPRPEGYSDRFGGALVVTVHSRVIKQTTRADFHTSAFQLTVRDFVYPHWLCSGSMIHLPRI